MNEKRIPGLDTLRAIAILAVVCFHLNGKVNQTFVNSIGHVGWAGVDLFFVLSGYLIGNQWFRGLALTDFYIRRALRILPSFLVVLSLYFIWPACRENELNVPLWRFLTFTQNFNLTFGAFSHAWSLCIEEQFYWLFPLTALFLSKKPRFCSIYLIAFVIIFGMAMRGIIWSHCDRDLMHAYYRLIYYPTYTRLDGLTMGIMVALIKNFAPNIWVKIKAKSSVVGFIGALIAAAALLLFEHPYALTTVIVGFPLLALGFGCLVASCASENGLLAQAQIPGASTLATLAYCIYLSHKQVFHLFLTPEARYPLLVFPVIFTAGWVLHITVEKPFLDLRGKKLFRGKPFLEQDRTGRIRLYEQA
jgi:peptidoglycan/LPS O-acetylase OafA/YrhL